MQKKNYVYIGNDATGRLYFCMEEEQIYKDEGLLNSRKMGVGMVFVNVFLYQIRNCFIFQGLTSETTIGIAIFLGSFLGIICDIGIKWYARKIYANQAPYNRELLDIPALIKNARKLRRTHRCCFLLILFLAVVSVWIAGMEAGNLLFLFVGIWMVFILVLPLPFYQPRRRKKAFAIMKEWNNSMI